MLFGELDWSIHTRVRISFCALTTVPKNVGQQSTNACKARPGLK